MNKWLRLMIVILIVISLTANLVLIGRGSSKVSRINHITDWSQIRKTDIVNTLPVDGVITEAEEHYVMVDKDETIEEFLVKEGDSVEAGSPLLVYRSDKINRQTAQLDAEIESLQSKKNSVENLIGDLKAMTPPVSTERSYKNYDYNKDEFDLRFLPDASQDFNKAEWQQAIDKEIGEKTLEAEKLEADIKKLEEQRASLDSDKDNLSVTSPIDGVVKEITPNSKSAMTIASDETVLKGELNEEQLSQVNEEMEVNILSHLFEGRLTGEITQIVKHPVDDPNHNKESLYPFTVVFDKEDKDIHNGYHVTADIILEEARDVPAVFRKSIREETEKAYIWVINEKGRVEKREISTGLKKGNLHEITKGAQEGEFYVSDHREAVKQAPFITPLDIYRLDKSSNKEISRKKALKYILIGVLQQ